MKKYTKENIIVLDNEYYHNISLNEPLCLYGEYILKELLDELLTSRYYSKIIKTIKQEKDSKILFMVNKNNNLYIVSSISLRNIIRYYEKTNDLLTRIKINYMKTLMDYKRLLNINKLLTYKIDNKIIEISTKEIIELIVDGNIDFIENKNIELEELLYIIKDYIKENALFLKYYFSDNIINSCNEKLSYFKNDYEAVNTYVNTNDNFIDQYEIDKELEKYILSKIPKEYNKIQKSIYVYYKLCTILSYDDDFYLTKNSYLGLPDSCNLKAINEITLINNKVKCYEFTRIYAKLLKKLGINYKIESLTSDYGVSHEYLTYRVDKYLIKADSTKNIIFGDIANIKTGNLPDGLECTNKNIKTHLEFEKQRIEIYKKVRNEYKKENEKESKPTIVFFKSLTGINNKLKEKILYFVQKTNETNLEGIDLINKLLTLENYIFTEREKEYNINLCVIKENLDNKCRTRIILTINNEDYYGENNKYYIADESFKEITKEELEKRFNSGKYEYKKNSTFKVPGLNIYSDSIKLRKMRN